MRSIFQCAVLVGVAVAGLCVEIYGQKPTDADDVVKISTKLVQIDVVVTGKNGEQVSDLTAKDFELIQDGKAQKIIGFSYVSTDSASVTSTVDNRTETKDKKEPLPPFMMNRSGAGGRMIAIVVDDGSCLSSIWGMNSTRSALQKFIREQMQPNDMVAIYRTRGGTSIMQQFTNDRNALLKVAESVKYYPAPLGCTNIDGSFDVAAKPNTYVVNAADGSSKTITIESDEEKKLREYREDTIQNNQVVGTLGVLNYIIRGLEKAPGRKLVMLMSDGIPTRGRTNASSDARNELREVTDRANRGGIVINTFDLRGANVPGMIEARDEVYVKDDFNATSAISNSRISDSRRNQEGLAILADETGGEFYGGSGKLEKPMAEILKRETGYYLLAYEPDEETFKGKKYNSISVKVNKPDTKVVYRSGFLGVPDENVSTKKRTGDSELYDAIAAPLPRPGLNLRLSAYFVNSATGANIVRSTFHINGSEITFADEPNGIKKAVLDVVAVTMNEKNEVVDEFTRTHTIKFDVNTANAINERGLVYSADVPVKKPGTYNFRVAVREGNSKMIGSATQVVTIPDLKRSGLILSGLTMANADATGKFDKPAAPTAETAISLPATTAVPAIRKFPTGSIAAYLYTIYNAKLDRTTGRPRLQQKVNLFQSGKLIVEGKPEDIDIKDQRDLGAIESYAYMQLSKAAEPGDYSIQIIITDLADGGKNAVTSQWIDFEIVNN
jgi:VWFA-related protein